MKTPAMALMVAAAFTIAACSQEHAADQAARVRVVAPVAHAAGDNRTAASPASAVTARAAANKAAVLGPYLSDLLKRADFAAAFNTLAGARELPAWTRDGGTATPARKVMLDGRALLLTHGCKPHDCASERLVLAYDEQGHAMWGVFARARSDQRDADESNDELSWLGEPGAELKAVLKQWLYQSA